MADSSNLFSLAPAAPEITSNLWIKIMPKYTSIVVLLQYVCSQIFQFIFSISLTCLVPYKSMLHTHVLLYFYNMFVHKFFNSSSVSVWLVWYLTDQCFFATGGVVGGGLSHNSSTVTILSGLLVFLIFLGSSSFPWLSHSITHY